MELELNDQQLDVLQDLAEAALGHLSEQIAISDMPARAVLRERRVMMRLLRKALETPELG